MVIQVLSVKKPDFQSFRDIRLVTGIIIGRAEFFFASVIRFFCKGSMESAGVWSLTDYLADDCSCPWTGIKIYQDNLLQIRLVILKSG